MGNLQAAGALRKISQELVTAFVFWSVCVLGGGDAQGLMPPLSMQHCTSLLQAIVLLGVQSDNIHGRVHSTAAFCSILSQDSSLHM